MTSNAPIPEPLPPMPFESFAALDIRIGRIIEALPFPEARQPAYKLRVDFGPLGIKRSSARITDHYLPEGLVGRQVVAVVNFPPRQVGPVKSEVLVLGAYDEAGSVILLAPERDMPLGARIG